jgi:bifunctional non-homologous end joining protein LigD
MRERLLARVREGAKSPMSVLKRSGVEPVEPGLIGRVRHLKGDEQLRHATLKEILPTDDKS